MNSENSTIDPCAGCQHHLTEHYDTICMECKRFYGDQFDDELEDREKV